MLVNTGHSLEWRVKPSSGPSVNLSGGPLSYTYSVSHLRLHFGERDLQGSEHTIANHAFPAEVSQWQVFVVRKCYLVVPYCLSSSSPLSPLSYSCCWPCSSSSSSVFFISLFSSYPFLALVHVLLLRRLVLSLLLLQWNRPDRRLYRKIEQAGKKDTDTGKTKTQVKDNIRQERQTKVSKENAENSNIKQRNRWRRRLDRYASKVRRKENQVKARCSLPTKAEKMPTVTTNSQPPPRPLSP